MSICVLLVDHSETHCRTLMAVLKSLGVNYVDYCRDAESALAKLGRNPDAWDAIFVDLEFVDQCMGGIQFFHMLGDLGYRGGVVVMSAEDNAMPSFAVELIAPYRLRVLGSLQKPFSEFSVAFLIKRVRHSGLRAGPHPRGMLRRAQVEDALEKNRLVPYFQPIVDLANHRLFGLECLIRLDIEGHGTVLPRAFLAVAEHFGLINAMTLSTLNSVLPQFCFFQDRVGQSCQLSVNLSPIQLADDALPRQLYDCVLKHRVHPWQLVFEVFEEEFGSDVTHTVNARCLRELGFGVALGGFGAGYTDLLKDVGLPYTQVKLDKLLVEGVSQDPVLHTIASNAFYRTQSLGIPLISEGVEKPADIDALSEIGVQYFQGYGVCRPKPLGDLIRWYGVWNGATRQEAGNAMQLGR